MDPDRDALKFTRRACPECRGRVVDGLLCQDMFEVLLAWEWQDPELGSVHFLTVSSYLLQHPASLTDAALAALRTAFTSVVDGELTVEQVRATHTKQFAGEQRVRRDHFQARPQLRSWTMTVAEVYTGGQSGAADRVRRWAESIREDMDAGPA